MCVLFLAAGDPTIQGQTLGRLSPNPARRQKDGEVLAACASGANFVVQQRPLLDHYPPALVTAGTYVLASVVTLLATGAYLLGDRDAVTRAFARSRGRRNWLRGSRIDSREDNS